MKLSQRQLELIQGAARVLIQNLELTHSEVLELISRQIRLELGKREITMEQLNYRARPERAAFIRHVIAGVHTDLRERKLWPAKYLDETIAEFISILHESWLNENQS